MNHSLVRNLLQTYAHNPKQKGLTTEQEPKSFISRVESCDDLFNIYIEKEQNIIKLARFEGNGCSISAAATELILKLIEGKKIQDSIDLLDNYEDYISGKKTAINEELKIFEIVLTHTSRKKCALAPLEAIRKGIKNG